MAKKAVEGHMNRDWISTIAKDRSTRNAIYEAGNAVKLVAESMANAKAKNWKPTRAMAEEMAKARQKGRKSKFPKGYQYGTTGRKLGGPWGLTYIIFPMSHFARDPKNFKLLEKASAGLLKRKKS